MSKDINDHHIPEYYHHREGIKAKVVQFLPIISMDEMFVLFDVFWFGEFCFDWFWPIDADPLIMFLISRTDRRNI